jgi:hypothetical protein
MHFYLVIPPARESIKVDSIDAGRLLAQERFSNGCFGDWLELPDLMWQLTMWPSPAAETRWEAGERHRDISPLCYIAVSQEEIGEFSFESVPPRGYTHGNC